MTEDNSFELKEEIQEKIFLERLNKSLQGKISDLENAKKQLETKLIKEEHDSKEAEHERILLYNINAKLEQKISKQNVKEEQGDFQKIDTIMSSYNQITLARLIDLLKIKQEKITEYLQVLESQGRIAKLQDRKEAGCPECSSVNLGIFFLCPFCKNSNYKTGAIIEHFSCGNFSLEDTYENNICPKCRKDIKKLGTDYQKMPNYHICNECDSRFQAPLMNFQCNNCSKRFEQNQTKWIASPLFKKI